MTKSQIKKTEWYKRFKKIATSNLEEALYYASDPNTKYCIYKNDDMYSGTFLYAIVVNSDKNFWMDAFDKKKDAVKFCKEMGWVLVN